MYEEIIKPVITVSVRNFVEFLLRSGNIDNRIKKATSDVQTMQEGARIHRLIQHKMGIEYHPEVMVSYISSFDRFDLKVEGRADGIIEGNPLTIDEIKTTHKDMIKLTEPDPVHLAQAKCYAYFVLKELDNKADKGIVTGQEIVVEGDRALSEICVRMTYCNADTLQCKYFHETYTFGELESFYTELVLQYKKWADFEITWPVERNESINNLTFPFEYRKGQKELVGQIYHTISENNRLFVEAPTGTGKTISTLYPSIKALAEGKGRRIFYLTAKTITRTAACECVDLLRQKALKLKSVVITAKEKVCMNTEPTQCNPDMCPYANGHFDRINEAVYDLLVNEDSFTRESIMEYAAKHVVCPFELSLDISLFCDAIICDYNYVFDPNVYLKRFFAEGIRDDYIFLVDEAHNLAERAMNMYSAEISKEDFLKIRAMVRPFDEGLAKAMEKSNKRLLEMKKICEKCSVVDDITPLIISLLTTLSNCDRFLEDVENFPDKEEFLDFYFKLRHFLNMYENMSEEDYLIYNRVNEKSEFVVKLLCTNPARSLKACLDKGVSTVFFSATLLPIQYFKDMLTGENDSAVYANSVFDPNKRGLFIAKDVSSKYTRRTETEYTNIASYINTVVRAHHGNYIVFFPSYSFMQSVLEPFEELYMDSDIMLLAQNPRMSEEEREIFLNCFADAVTDMRFKSLVGFCVIGGIFSEGIDLKGDNLIGSIIVGTGLPMVSEEREILKNKYDEEGFNGFDYAYRYPGMNKVLQAAGRVIRTEEDSGVVVLLDERFNQINYTKLFPREWKNMRRASLRTIEGQIEQFWQTVVSSK
ncbi:MAG: ATP-dependent DNA helicase [Lachnospiraceae bacterium]|nr:ATP-dependent DNA helicase [Lachnospiraceae bacterium]